MHSEAQWTGYQYRAVAGLTEWRETRGEECGKGSKQDSKKSKTRRAADGRTSDQEMLRRYGDTAEGKRVVVGENSVDDETRMRQWASSWVSKAVASGWRRGREMAGCAAGQHKRGGAGRKGGRKGRKEGGGRATGRGTDGGRDKIGAEGAERGAFKG
eukprot:2949266-Pleurochrysis_carterae.AAC.1